MSKEEMTKKASEVYTDDLAHVKDKLSFDSLNKGFEFMGSKYEFDRRGSTLDLTYFFDRSSTLRSQPRLVFTVDTGGDYFKMKAQVWSFVETYAKAKGLEGDDKLEATIMAFKRFKVPPFKIWITLETDGNKLVMDRVEHSPVWD